MPGRKALSRWSDAVRCLSICLAISAFIVGPSLSQTIPEQIDSVISDQNETVRRYSAPRKLERSTFRSPTRARLRHPNKPNEYYSP